MGAKSDLKDGYFLGRSCTDIIADLAAGVFTLAGISALQIGEQARIGWIEAMRLTGLYGQTSAGVWVPNRTNEGYPIIFDQYRLYQVNAGRLSSELTVPTMKNPSIAGSATMLGAAEIDYRKRVYNIVPFTSNAGGNLAADVDLTPAAVASYYYIARILALKCTDAALTPTLVLQDSAAAACSCGNLSPGTTAAYVPLTTLQNVPITTSTDNVKLVIDTTSSGLGNTKSWVAIVEYWLET